MEAVGQNRGQPSPPAGVPDPNAKGRPRQKRRRRQEYRPQPPTLATRSLALLLILICAASLLYAASNFRNDLLYWEAHFMQQRWNQAGSLPDLEAIHRAQQLHRKALSWTPDNPAHLDSLVYLLRLELFHVIDTDTYIGMAREALAMSETARQQRPTWSYNYSQAALFKSMLGEYDDEWEWLLQQAWALGPWEEINLVQVAEAGILRWPSLNAEQRERTLTAMVRAMRHSRSSSDYLQAILQDYARKEPICAELATFDILTAGGRPLPRNFCP
jgi:hypothetical protein